MLSDVIELGADSPDSVFSVLGLRHRYHPASGAVTALDEIDLDIPADGLTVLGGPSGSGKSTLLRILGLLERPTQGRVRFRGKETTALRNPARRALRRRVHLLFQNPVDNLFSYLTVAENLKAAAELAGRPKPDLELLDRLGLPGTADWQISALSGGQQQRLAFLTAVAAGAEVVLADEPTSQLDEASGALVVRTLRELVELGVIVIVASHDDAVLSQATRTFRLLDGRLVEQGEQ